MPEDLQLRKSGPHRPEALRVGCGRLLYAGITQLVVYKSLPNLIQLVTLRILTVYTVRYTKY